MKTCECTKCRIVYVRERVGTSSIFLDARGKRWNGRRCPDCASARQQAFNRKYRAEGRYKGVLTADEGEIMYPPKLRPCRRCNTMNANYYFCASCYSDKRAQGSVNLVATEMMSLHGGAAY